MKNQTHIQGIVFDIDDTLYPERDFVRSGYRAVGEYLRESLDRSDDFEDWLWDRFVGGKTAGAFNDLSDVFKLNLGDDAIRELINVYRFHRPTIEPYRGIRQLVYKLGREFVLGIVSDGPSQMQQNKLFALGFAGCFDAVVLTGDLDEGLGKPDPAGFNLVSSELYVAPENCLYIADNPTKDFVAPNKLGWMTIQYKRKGQIYADRPAPNGGEPQRVITSDKDMLWILKVRD
ncbi:MAG: HAD family hydrolase [Phycisphaerae bacterium]|nr:HAD family hydrolase [Phycisphaerae bacterium]